VVVSSVIGSTVTGIGIHNHALVYAVADIYAVAGVSAVVDHTVADNLASSPAHARKGLLVPPLHFSMPEQSSEPWRLFSLSHPGKVLSLE
jgi:hypothetical protein